MTLSFPRSGAVIDLDIDTTANTATIKAIKEGETELTVTHKITKREAKCQIRVSSEVMFPSIFKGDVYGPGSLIVNGRAIGNTRIIDGNIIGGQLRISGNVTYGSIADFANAVGGCTIMTIEAGSPGNRFVIGYRIRIGNKNFNLYLDGRASNIGYRLIDVAGQRRIIVELQPLVDAAGGMVARLEYDTGTAGGTYRTSQRIHGDKPAQRHTTWVFVPRSQAREAYESNAFNESFDALSNIVVDPFSAVAAILGARLLENIDKLRFGNELNREKPFMKFTIIEQSMNSSTRFEAHDGGRFEVKDKIVGTYRYDEWFA